jgi:hypothetical protein
MRDIGKALLLAVIMATIYTLLMWGLLSLVGYPSWTHHHSFDFLSWIFVVYTAAFYSGVRN